uniref:hypothetical protein n=1 Tax=Amycolatopsis sp. CA-151526 TaxID=3239921 RepID=UPI003F497F25
MDHEDPAAADEPISVEGLRRRLTYIRDNTLERLDMTPHQRGVVDGARDMATVVLAMLERVQCTCPPPGATAPPPVHALPNDIPPNRGLNLAEADRAAGHRDTT